MYKSSFTMSGGDEPPIDLSYEPHLRQAGGASRFRAFHHLERTLAEDAPRLPYEVFEERSTRHWGQRKLLLAEVEFLTECAPAAAGGLVVYAGAAPGTHVALLAELFPALRFMCVDPRPFELTASPRVELRQEFFTDELAEELAGRHEPLLLFVSDVRTADPRVQREPEALEAAVAADQARQMGWVLRLRPAASLLKFRLPWGEGRSRYLRGEVRLPVWGRPSTTETRLLCLGAPEMAEYEHLRYNEQLCHFNRVARVDYYDHPTLLEPDSDHCYDCAAEDLILRRYLGRLSAAPSHEEVQRLARRVTRGCSSHSRTSARRRQFRPLLFDYERRTVTEMPEEGAPVSEERSAFGQQVARDAAARLEGEGELRYAPVSERQAQEAEAAARECGATARRTPLGDGSWSVHVSK